MRRGVVKRRRRGRRRRKKGSAETSGLQLPPLFLESSASKFETYIQQKLASNVKKDSLEGCSSTTQINADNINNNCHHTYLQQRYHKNVNGYMCTGIVTDSSNVAITSSKS